MDRFAQRFASGLMLAAAAMLVGCSGGASGLLGGNTTAAGDAPGGGLNNDDPALRPVAVAWTSARAQRCGFYFDAAKLRSSYLVYEARQSSPEQLAKAEKSYDSTFKAIRERVAADPDYCSNSKSAEIKKDLTRHLAGDFTPDFPKPKVVASCGLFGCGDVSDQKWSADKFWADQEKKTAGTR
jgi:hypothetical protein